MAFEMSYASPDYFSVVGPRVVRGRGFRDEDRPDAPFVVVVNSAFAHRFWPGSDPVSLAIGHQLRVGSREVTIIGVVADAKYHAMSESPKPFYYLPYEQWSPSALTIALRASGDPMALVEPLRRTLHAVNPALPFLDPRTLSDQIDGALTLQRLGATLLSVLGGLALSIATLGLYAVLSQAVVLRRREIGIRMALGASARLILRQFTVRGGILAAAALVLALPGVFVAARLVQGQLYGVGATDPMALGAAILVFIIVAIVASVVTAARAARLDPALIMRES